MKQILLGLAACIFIAACTSNDDVQPEPENPNPEQPKPAADVWMIDGWYASRGNGRQLEIFKYNADSTLAASTLYYKGDSLVVHDRDAKDTMHYKDGQLIYMKTWYPKGGYISERNLTYKDNRLSAVKSYFKVTQNQAYHEQTDSLFYNEAGQIDHVKVKNNSLLWMHRFKWKDGDLAQVDIYLIETNTGAETEKWSHTWHFDYTEHINDFSRMKAHAFYLTRTPFYSMEPEKLSKHLVSRKALSINDSQKGDTDTTYYQYTFDENKRLEELKWQRKTFYVGVAGVENYYIEPIYADKQ